jgi:glycosyltransferase involved in cell wall biosynthesis
MPRILFLNKAPPYRETGAEQVVWNVGTHLADAGWDVHFLSPGDSNPPSIDNVVLHEVETPNSFFAEKATFFLKGIPAYRQVTSAIDPDIIYDNASPFPFLYAYFADPKRVITKVHAIYGLSAFENKHHPITQVGTVVGEQFYRLMDGNRLLTISESTRNRLQPLVRRNPDGITVVRNGIEAEDFEYSFEPKGPVVTLCELTPRKNIAALLQAWSQIENKGTNRRLVVAGDGPLREDLETLARELSLTAVTFRGYVSDEEKVKLLRDAFCYVLPSRMEGFGLTNLEAMAGGCVVVSSETAGVRDYLNDGTNGIAVPVDDPLALSEALIDLLENSDKFEELARRGRETAESHRIADILEHEQTVLEEKLEAIT